MDQACRVSVASPCDAAAIAGIYNQGIRSRKATFETALRTDEDIRTWFENGSVIVGAYRGKELAGYAAIFEYRPRACYAGVGDFSIYVDDRHQGRGVGGLIMDELIPRATEYGYWKLLSRIFPENVACRSLLGRVGFREVGVYEKHAKLDGQWRDVVIVERVLA